MENLETVLVVMVALTLSVLSVLVWVGLWLHHQIAERAEAEEERAAREEETHHEQQSALARLSMDLHHARADIMAMRRELETHTYGPPSLRSPTASVDKP